MTPGLSLRVAQHLTLTPQLQQSIRLLQLTTLELAGEVEQMLGDNPFLERDDAPAPREEFGLARADAPVSAGDRMDERLQAQASEPDADGAESADWAEAGAGWEGDGSVDAPPPDDAEWGGDAPACASASARAGDDDDMLDAGERAAPQASLAEHLNAQARTLRLEPEEAATLRYLIGNLGDNGYLEESLAQLAARFIEDDDNEEQIQLLMHRFTLALRLLQSLEPAGVGGRGPAECLALQIKRQLYESPDPEQAAALRTALLICEHNDALEWLARRDAKRIAQTLLCAESQARAAMALIARLDPKPGRAFAEVAHNVIVPDVIVSASGAGAGQRLSVQLNPDVAPRLRVQELYARALRGSRDTRGSAGHQALAQRLQEARWFVRNIQQRLDTILRVARMIVQRQRGFFSHGELAMRPLVQGDLAEELGLHPSTISRVTTGKYMATPRGTFEFKYFFGSAVATEAGGNASSTAVRALIKQFIAAEDTAKPLADGHIADLLKAQGIACARRTVAKYREGLRIPVASLRKTKAVSHADLCLI
ncbi:MAG: RNA polymerase factor sigma-54 [Burkholderiaceae bacterium]|jgi:RNA polymerase sigma-54 factor|nr:RNA polymerase factor sigma-54 [Burkholderiaceae bacterium]